MRALAQRYAAALADIAVEQGSAEQLKKDLASFVSMFRESADLRNFLASPAVPRANKQAAIEKMMGLMGADGALRNFLFVLARNGRTGLLPQIQQEFETQLYDRMGAVEAHIVSTAELSAQEQTELKKTLERLTGKHVEPRYGLDPKLIGGAVVRIGSAVYDGSVRQQLNRLRASLEAE